MTAWCDGIRLQLPRQLRSPRLAGLAWFAVVMMLALWVPSLLPQALSAAEDPYQEWSHGHPQEALPGLLARAQASDRWDAWLDAGLAAAAANDRGRAAAWLLMARERAPERDEPRDALRALDLSVPPTWFSTLGPLTWPGCGWPGALLAALMGLALGYACVARRHRGRAVATAVACALLVAPGQIALEHERRIALVAAIRDTRLLDSVGNPGLAVACGTIAVREPQDPWAGRLLVTLPGGARGYLPIADTIPPPVAAAGAAAP
jgi:hypothetical protein